LYGSATGLVATQSQCIASEEQLSGGVLGCLLLASTSRRD
jgi:hypothetical protein